MPDLAALRARAIRVLKDAEKARLDYAEREARRYAEDTAGLRDREARRIDTVREKLAEYAHAAWSGWMDYLFTKSVQNHDGTVTIPVWAVERWKRQSATRYADIPECEKQSDREEADRMLEIFGEARRHSAERSESHA